MVSVHRRDYKMLAAVLKDARQQAIQGLTLEQISGALQMRAWIARNLAHELRGQNHRFNRVQFLEACGMEVLLDTESYSRHEVEKFYGRSTQ